ncbi:MAG: hypothetical protein WD645_03995 [Dehalococcoidia bacterium]
MEKPVFVPRDPRVYTVQVGAPIEGRVFVVDDARWYERLKDDNGKAFYAHMADSDEEFHLRLSEEGEQTPMELGTEDAIARVALDEFVQEGFLYPEVPEVSDEDATAA